MLASFFSLVSLFIFGSYRMEPVKPVETHILASHEFSLSKRYGNQFVNDVFKDNILLTLSYMENKNVNPLKIDWKSVEKPFSYNLVLHSKETFAFHDDVLPQFSGKVDKTTNAHFDYDQGFKSDGWLTGDGVCHLASLMYWAAKDAGLSALAPTRHDFAIIPQVPREYGVSIYDFPGQSFSNEVQNLYITNTFKKDVTFEFVYNGDELKVSVVD